MKGGFSQTEIAMLREARLAITQGLFHFLHFFTNALIPLLSGG